MLLRILETIYNKVQGFRLTKAVTTYSDYICSMTCKDVTTEDWWKERYTVCMEVLHSIVEYSCDKTKVLSKLSNKQVDNIKIDATGALNHLECLGDLVFGPEKRRELQKDILNKIMKKEEAV